MDEWRCVMAASGRLFVIESGAEKKQRWFAHSSTTQIYQVCSYTTLIVILYLGIKTVLVTPMINTGL